MKKDAVVIGGGPGGYVAGIRLGQLGKSVVVIEKDQLGGVCLNWGCIPSKALIQAAKTYEHSKNSTEMGIVAKGVQINLKKTQAWKNEVVKKLTSGVGQLLKANGGDVLQGTATFTSKNSLVVRDSKGTQTSVEFGSAIVATGSRPLSIPGFEIDGKNVVDSKDALDWTRAPKRMTVIGGGVIGMEIAMLYEKFGTKVTVVELTSQLLPGVDSEISKTLLRLTKKRNIEVYLSSKALKYTKKKQGLEVQVQTPEGNRNISADVILLSVGRIPNGTGLGLEKVGVKVSDKGSIPVDSQMRSNIQNIYAIGDVVGPPLLAHKASKEGLVAAEVIAGHPAAFDVQAMPGAIFTDPEIATVGITEDEAAKQGLDYIVGKFPLAALGRALASDQSDGMMKIVADRKTKLILGGHLIGAHASDLISEVSLAIEMGSTLEDLALTVHPHPTMSEGIMEAAEAAMGTAIHIVNRNEKRKEEKKRA